MKSFERDPAQLIALLPEDVRTDLLDFLTSNTKDFGPTPEAEVDYILNVAALHRGAYRRFVS